MEADRSFGAGEWGSDRPPRRSSAPVERPATHPWFAALVESFPYALFVLRASGECTFHNAAADQLLGWLGLFSGEQEDLLAALLAVDGLHRVRVTTPSHGVVRGTVWARPGSSARAVLLRHERVRDRDLHAELMKALGIDAPAARLALRIYRGLSNKEIADAFDVPLGTLKWRTSRLYRQLGVRRRPDLVKLVRGVLGQLELDMQGTEEISGRGLERPPGGEPRELPHVAELLGRAAMGFGVFDAAGEPLWCSPECLGVLAVCDAATLDQVGRACRVVHARDPGVIYRLRLRDPLGRVHVSLWQVGDDHVGAQIHREQLREASVIGDLADRFGLTERQARVAVALVQGRSYREIATEIGVRPGTVSSHVTTVYQKLGVRDRRQLLGLVEDLAG